MVQLQILSGKKAGDTQVVRHFPFCIGRAREDDLILDEPGVWDNHLTLDFEKTEGFVLRTAAGAFAAVNAESQSTATRLRNGDIISFGATKIQFWLAAPRQRGLRVRELFVWFLLAGVTAFQFVLIYRLVK
jgi:pSer/pThr/pTyr-binding forkhead associated (FHA) protein